MSLYEGAVKRPIMTSLCFAAVMILGIFSVVQLPIDLYPDIDTNTIMVLTYYNKARNNMTNTFFISQQEKGTSNTQRVSTTTTRHSATTTPLLPNAW